jgi:hypothetical protein
MRNEARDQATICRRVDSALVFVTGIGIGADRLSAFLEEFRDSHASLADPLAWPASSLEAAFRRAFGVPVSVRRYAFDPAHPGIAFYIRRAAGGDLEQRPVA